MYPIPNPTFIIMRNFGGIISITEKVLVRVKQKTNKNNVGSLALKKKTTKIDGAMKNYRR